MEDQQHLQANASEGSYMAFGSGTHYEMVLLELHTFKKPLDMLRFFPSKIPTDYTDTEGADTAASATSGLVLKALVPCVRNTAPYSWQLTP